MSVSERIAAIEKECEGVWGQSGITDWERQRLAAWRGFRKLSYKQETILRAIEAKAGLRKPHNG